VRVRIGLHSGYPTVTVDNYLGMAVHTAARVCSAAHGGQVLVTADTRLAVQSTREGGVRFRGLGTYQLRGIPAPVALFQVGAKGLPTRFPPLRATLAP
jgi:class 3 adenylate cyclase